MKLLVIGGISFLVVFIDLCLIRVGRLAKIGNPFFQFDSLPYQS